MQNKCKINLKKQEIIIKYHAASFDKLHAQQDTISKQLCNIFIKYQ